MTGRRFDHLGAGDNEVPLVLAAQRVLRTPARTVPGSFVPAFDDFPGELRMALSRLADHVRGHLDGGVPIPQIQHARDALAVAIGEPGIGRQV
jgi:hypothetical protein